MENLAFAPAYQLAASIRQRRISASVVLEAHIEQISRHNPTLNAIVTLNEDEARKKAIAAQKGMGTAEELTASVEFNTQPCSCQSR